MVGSAGLVIAWLEFFRRYVMAVGADRRHERRSVLTSLINLQTLRTASGGRRGAQQATTCSKRAPARLDGVVPVVPGAAEERLNHGSRAKMCMHDVDKPEHTARRREGYFRFGPYSATQRQPHRRQQHVH